jgi:5-formyltetrahydrofolate cyclo-ligase
LYIRAGRQSSAVFVNIKVPDDSDEKTQKKAVNVNSAVAEYGTDIDINTEIKLDMLVIGSCAVSRKGHRIGRGNGYVDLDFAILKDLGIITPKTLIVTTVHDCQVYDELPLDLFQNYDIPVDMIVTPTEVIRIENKLPRPDGIIWHLLSERRLGVVPVLKEIKEKFEKY